MYIPRDDGMHNWRSAAVAKSTEHPSKTYFTGIKFLRERIAEKHCFPCPRPYNSGCCTAIVVITIICTTYCYYTVLKNIVWCRTARIRPKFRLKICGYRNFFLPVRRALVNDSAGGRVRFFSPSFAKVDAIGGRIGIIPVYRIIPAGCCWTGMTL